MKFSFLSLIYVASCTILLSFQGAEIEHYSVSVCSNDAAFCSCRERNSYLYWQVEFTMQVLINKTNLQYKYLRLKNMVN
jgi:hypothetical protein